MQNRYVGDVGDFGKYGLLRALCQPIKDDRAKLSLGVIWYLVDGEEENNDGKHIKYLKDTSFGDCDQKLFDTLSQLVHNGQRDVKNIQNNGILPRGTVYYDKILKSDRGYRENWVKEAFEETAGCDVIFVDPDNGLEVPSVKPHYKHGPKYVFFDELLGYLDRDQSLVIYQHLSRNGNAKSQVKQRVSQIKKHLNCCAGITSLRFHRGTARVFFIIPSKKHKRIISERVDQFSSTLWFMKKHFSLMQ